VINNAGLMPQSLLERLKVEEWDRMIDMNRKAQKSGHIINVSSVAGHKVAPGGTVYSANTRCD
jgi:NADP-dependent 3-hydroxy acid dehydrogenase YdfG